MKCNELLEIEDVIELATGEVLDKIGCNIYCVFRNDGETDHDYRIRIKGCRHATACALQACAEYFSPTK